MAFVDRDAAGIGALSDPLRRRLYLFVCAQPHPVSRELAAEALGLAPHQAKFHLDRLERGGLLDSAYARVSVWDAEGKQVDAGDAAVDQAGATTLAVRTPGLRAGRYTVRYRVLSVDGHIVESSFHFTVRPAAAPAGIQK